MSYKYNHGAKLKKRPKLVVFLFSLTTICGGVLVAIHTYGLHYPPAPRLAQSVATHKSASIQNASINYGLPVRLQVSKLHIDAPVIYVGLTKDGSMSVPTNVIDVGWYKYSALPGNSGTAVIAGHLDGLRGEPGVFSNLDKLDTGDTITITESNGSTVTFVVREKRSYPHNAQPDEVFKSSSGSHLNLITCTGSWDDSEHRFAERLVVFADKSP